LTSKKEDNEQLKEVTYVKDDHNHEHVSQKGGTLKPLEGLSAEKRKKHTEREKKIGEGDKPPSAEMGKEEIKKTRKTKGPDQGSFSEKIRGEWSERGLQPTVKALGRKELKLPAKKKRIDQPFSTGVTWIFLEGGVTRWRGVINKVPRQTLHNNPHLQLGERSRGGKGGGGEKVYSIQKGKTGCHAGKEKRACRRELVWDAVPTLRTQKGGREENNDKEKGSDHTEGG